MQIEGFVVRFISSGVPVNLDATCVDYATLKRFASVTKQHFTTLPIRVYRIPHAEMHHSLVKTRVIPRA